MDNDIPQYDIDDDTRTLLSSVLELAFLTCNLQLDNRNAESIANICFQTAARFGIELHIQELGQPTEQKYVPPMPGMDLKNLPFTINIIDKGSK
jgi:hypothetical protein